MFSRFISASSNSREFKLSQALFWFGVFLVTLITLTLWYKQFDLVYFVHNFLQTIAGFALTFPMYWIFTSIWHKPAPFRIIIIFIAVLIVSFLWTLLRMKLFGVLIHEVPPWHDFGGWYFGGIFIFLAWASMFHGLRYYELLEKEHELALQAVAQSKKHQIKRAQAQTEARDAQLQMLRYQLNPHFLCNTLNGINSLIQLDESKKAQTMAVQLSQFLRYSLDSTHNEKTSLEVEIRALMLYLKIEQTRFGDRLSLDFDVTEKANQALLPSLLLQPIIENSMKYAIAKSENGGTISLRASAEQGWLKLQVADTGPGVKSEHCRGHRVVGRGVGLSNIDDRLSVLYGSNYSFDLQADPAGGMETTIKIPFEQLEQ